MQGLSAMRRKRFTEREVIETLVRQGADIVCYRTRVLIGLEDVPRLEREHFIELALGGKDDPSNCVYSLKEAHAVVTNGTKATTAGSSKHKVAKDRRLRMAQKAKAEVEVKLTKEKWRLKKKVDGTVVRVRTA